MTNYSLLIIAFSIALGLSYLLTPLMRQLALRANILSRPGKRSVHTQPIPFLGGLAIYFAFIITVGIMFWISPQLKMEFWAKVVGLLIGATLIVTLGLWDDIKNIRPLTKLIGQVIVACILFGYKFRIEVITNPLGGELKVPFFLSILITVGWVVGIINALNLIDGLDGLAGGIVFISSTALLFISLFLHNYITALMLTILAGGSLGFLRFNFHPAKIFMGDTGSMFLGYILATAVLMELQYKSATVAALLIPVTALAIPIYDTSMTIVRRILRKSPVFRADKKHLHHRLLSIGLKHKSVVLFLYFISIYFGAIAFLFVLIPKEYAFILLILLALGVYIGVRATGFIERKLTMMQAKQKG